MQIMCGDNIMMVGHMSEELSGHQNWNCRTLEGPCSATRLWNVETISTVHPKPVSIKQCVEEKSWTTIDISFDYFVSFLDLANSFVAPLVGIETVSIPDTPA